MKTDILSVYIVPCRVRQVKTSFYAYFSWKNTCEKTRIVKICNKWLLKDLQRLFSSGLFRLFSGKPHDSRKSGKNLLVKKK